ncbi:four helix bundle protein [Patescibacteria group bacterium]|nr:four helix bundle protein [Patescibacteria group bacterium]
MSSDNLDIPIFKKAYSLYKDVHLYRSLVPKQDRYTLWQRCDNTSLDIIEGILLASGIPKDKKSAVLEEVSRKLNLLRILLRLAYDVKSIDNKKYIHLQSTVDEIGRMLGGWIKSTKD